MTKMTDKVELVLTGARAAAAADVVALGLMAAGAMVDFPGRVHRDGIPGQTLRGVKAVIQLAPSGDLNAPFGPRPTLRFASVARICIGVALLLMLFGAELRLNFGLRLDTIFTLAAICAFWRYCLAVQGDAALA